MDVFFRFGAVPNRYQDVVQRMAVLYPLVGITHSDDDVRQRTQALLEFWRSRATLLVDAGYVKRQRQDNALNFLRNCRPAFVITTPPTRLCGLPLMCPFCYARWVRTVWESLSAGIHPASSADTESLHQADWEDIPLSAITLGCGVQDEWHSRRSTQHLVERHHYFYRPAPTDKTELQAFAYLLSDIIKRRTALIKQVDPVGAFLYTTVEPWDGGMLRIHHRQLFKLAASQAFPAEIVSNTKGSITRFEQPTRRDVLGIVARVCRYPLRVLTDSPQLVTQLFSVRREINFRGNATYRSFRDIEGMQ